jgi:hypothetical protein
MEDILSSIRKILSEEEEGGSADEKTPQEKGDAKDTVGQGDNVSPQEVADSGPTEEKEASSPPDAGEETDAASADEKVVEAEKSSVADAQPPEDDVSPKQDDDTSPGEVEHSIGPVEDLPGKGQQPIPGPMAEILELTPDMVASDILSQPTARASVDVLSELASAILDRRDVQVKTGTKELTLESMVREMLKPILREWLDRNLPYLIERLVKKEIDLMVNRAERLDL